MTLTQNPDTVTAAIAPGETVEQWFDRELRPVLLHLLDQVRRQGVAEREATFASVRHWLGELPQRSTAWAPETQQVVTGLAGELRNLTGAA